MSNCGSKCKNDQLCFQGCITSSGNQRAIDLTKCAVRNDCLKGIMTTIVKGVSTAVSVADPISCIT
jgi:hypothetical protein